MMQGKYYGYVRVSTQKQGEKGVSLQEQRDAIARYAAHGEMEIAEWFEERETAAKRGRPIFNTMLNLLKTGKADGVVIHKIDRSARNLKDWADLGEMIDQGIEVHFANESLDLHSRGGRLSADIQAVVAADYIRNLREETKKGMYGRLKQGFYPLPAPIGYLNKGKAQVKEIDPIKGPLVKRLFTLYGTAKYNLHTLLEEANRIGLQNRREWKMSINGIATMLNNPFYIGLIRIRKTGETFEGNHPPLITKTLFDQVQSVLRGRTNVKSKKHELTYRRMLKCASCGYSLIGEVQKGRGYYRCHTRSCPTTTAREDRVEEEVLRTLCPLRFLEKEKPVIQELLTKLRNNWNEARDGQTNALTLRLKQIQDRYDRLTDTFLDRLIEKEIFEERKTSLLMEKKEMEEKLAEFKGGSQAIPDKLSDFLELAESAYLSYKLKNPDEKREFLKIVTSNRKVEGKKVDFMLDFPFDAIAKRFENTYCGQYRGIHRTWSDLFVNLVKFFQIHDIKGGK